MNFSKEPKVKSLKESVRSESIKFARLCFNHIGGKLAVSLLEKLLDLNFAYILGENIILTKAGLKHLNSLGFQISQNSCIGSLCRDWSEKNYHISGALGNNLYRNLCDLNLISKGINSREITVTSTGKDFFEKNFNLFF